MPALVTGPSPVAALSFKVFHPYTDLLLHNMGPELADICLGEARKNGAHLPVAALVDQFYSEVQKMGGKRWDTSSLIALLDR